MTHEINYKKVQIIDSDLTFEKIYEKKYIPSEYLDEIKKANLLIVPNENFRKKEMFFFLKQQGNSLNIFRTIRMMKLLQILLFQMIIFNVLNCILRLLKLQQLLSM